MYLRFCARSSEKFQIKVIKIEIIANDQANRTTPTMVAFTLDERLVGDFAKSGIASNPTNTVFNAKRIFGRRYSDPCVQSHKPSTPFSPPCVVFPTPFSPPL
ncbi:hypothetical protein SUGI_0624270 [Cryptomeria japonica]|nr:hypothetical protein SUGI_0624270 [Cryptomeria japonica]